MNDDLLETYKYLWDGSSPGWVLLKAPELPGGYSIFHKINRTLLHIDSSSLRELLCDMMKKSGCETLEDFPPGNMKITALPM